RPLGQGTFSSVWLAEDLSPTSLLLRSRRSLRDLKRKASSGSTLSSHSHHHSRNTSQSHPQSASPDSNSDPHIQSTSTSISAPRYGALTRKLGEKKPKALSSTSNLMRKLQRERDRTRVSFVREVEVLKHIAHPNITPLLSHLTTRTHHVLVMPYLPGGDLLGLVNDDIAWNNLAESTVRRIFAELCKAVSWMHSVGLVHRDIKLEKFERKATSSFLSSSPNSYNNQIPPPSHPLIKLADFGLSRFIDPAKPLLTTRCGSEAYAAPELVMSGGYDARETDAWACGVVLFGLIARRLPFGEGPGEVLIGGPGGKLGGNGAKQTRPVGASERRQWLMKIARGDWQWPDIPEDANDAGSSNMDLDDGGAELKGPRLAASEGAKRVASRLLVRDPTRRWRLKDLWDDDWVSRTG
ncbi:kinase-like protein, partial [Dendrothele bispora CBS 962.96]